VEPENEEVEFTWKRLVSVYPAVSAVCLFAAQPRRVIATETISLVHC